MSDLLQLTPFERHLAGRLAVELDAAVHAFDPVTIADRAMQGRRSMTPRRRLVLLAVSALLLVGAAVAVGAGWVRIPLPQPPLPWPLKGVLEHAGSLATGEQVPVAAVLHDGRVLNVHAELTSLPNTPAEIWDPATGAIQQVGAPTKAADGSQLVVLQDGRVLLYGGDGGGWPPTAEIFDPQTGTFSVLASRPSTIDGAPILLRDGRVLLSGGAEHVEEDDTGTGNRGISSRAEIFNPNTGVFTPVGDMRFQRAGHEMFLLKDGRVLVLGGWSVYGGGTLVPTAEIFDPGTVTFTVDDRPPLYRSIVDFAAARLSDDRLMILRQPGWGTFPDFPPKPMAVTFYDLETGAQTAGPTISASVPFTNVRTVMPLSDSRVVLFGFDKMSCCATENGTSEGRGWLGVLDLDTGLLSNGILREASWGTIVALHDGSLLVIGGTKLGKCDDGIGVCMNATGDLDVLR